MLSHAVQHKNLKYVAEVLTEQDEDNKLEMLILQLNNLNPTQYIPSRRLQLTFLLTQGILPHHNWLLHGQQPSQ